MGAESAAWDRTNLLALKILVTNRRPTFIMLSSKSVSAPSRALADQYRTASTPYWSSRSVGVIALRFAAGFCSFDLESFCRFGSNTHPEMTTLLQGTVPS